MTDIREAMRSTAAAHEAVPFDVPEWGQKVYIRRMSVRDGMRDDNEKDPKKAGLKMLIRALVDENGEQLLSDSDFELLLDQPLAIITPILVEAAKHNGFSIEEVSEAMQAFVKAPSESNSSE